MFINCLADDILEEVGDGTEPDDDVSEKVLKMLNKLKGFFNNLETSVEVKGAFKLVKITDLFVKF